MVDEKKRENWELTSKATLSNFGLELMEFVALTSLGHIF